MICHHFCIESSAGGRDKYRHFVREYHRRGIAVIQDVVCNHYDNEAERAQWAYDSPAPEQNIYYWYEGHPADYAFPDGGYLDSGSTGYTPRFWEKDVLVIPTAGWKEIFNSDAAQYGGRNVGNQGAIPPSTQGRLTVVIPASGFVVLVKQ